MKEALVLIMLALLIVPLLIGVRRIRRLPRKSSSREEEQSGSHPGEGRGP
jgi:hypothetical protein